ncbi:butyrophilin subfamily 1 member A1-like isoform X2 [Micropterus salmoides]|uniref:butyrophilin subfamily 1 member A1-like isoform X2 n=1 Tax=Micropterus salmoides TaxID=27706 RepID=UPI0018EE3627|nr:butyrophilin subfamily 1 member A1-like isoform X2 [Micropterus salmoides]
MIHIDRLIWKPHLSGFSSMVLHHIAVLLLLTHSCGGQSQVTGPSQPIVAMIGDDIILPCYLEPAVDAADITVEWARPDLEPRFVHLRRDGVELLLEEHPLYMGRTSLSVNKLKRGDISLKLSKVKFSDAGTYRCLVPTPGTESVIDLAVGAVSSPEIHISTVSKGVMLDCKSKGWYPEPEVFWLDGEGNLLSAGPTETVRGPDDLYTVSSRVTVEKRHSNSFTCRVQQKDINQTRQVEIHIPENDEDQAERGDTSKKIKTFSNDAELQLLLEGERVQHMTDSEQLVYLDKMVNKLNEELQRNEEESEIVIKAVGALKEYKTELDNYRFQLERLPEWIERQINVFKRLQSDAFRDEKKNTYREIITDLQKRKEATGKLLEDTKKLLQRTEEEVLQKTERKIKLENLKEPINEHLKVIKSQRDEILVKLQTE